MDAIKNSSVRLKALIWDGNRTNNACFIETIEGKPWMSAQGIYLLFDFVHLLKSLRNLWITEKSSQLFFEDNGKEHLADFNHIKDLYKWEKKDRVKMSELDEVSVYPKPIERQRMSMSTCLKVFSEKTIEALEDYGKIKSVDVSATILFLTKIPRWWTICNVRQKNVNLRKVNPCKLWYRTQWMNG